MKRKMRNKLILLSFIFIAIALFSFSAFAFSTRMELTTNVVCPENTIIINDIIKADSTSSFTISKSGSAASFTSVIPSGFFLEANQEQIVYEYITPKSTTKPGKYDLLIKISDGMTIKEIKHEIIVESCHKTQVNVEAPRISCPCEKNQFELTLKNNGVYMEDFTIEITGPLARWTSLSESKITMSKDETKKIIAYVDPPCNVYGEYDLNFIATSQSGIREEASTSLDIKACYEYQIVSQNNYYSICEKEIKVIPITIKNRGTADSTYKLKLAGADWGNLNKKEVLVKKAHRKLLI